MNRRAFLNNILVAGASFTILPGAGRVWHTVRESPRLLTWTELDQLVYSCNFVGLRQTLQQLHDAGITLTPPTVDQEAFLRMFFK